jgi:imidazole glycerol-phosphate synthase subunit HisH
MDAIISDSIMSKISIIDYDMGNVWSIVSALKYLGVDSELISDPEKISNSKLIILPGVGSFQKAMEILKSRGMDEAIINSVLKRNVKILGICLGMQLLGSYGTENGGAKGLGLIKNKVEIFRANELGKYKVPHVGFNRVDFKRNTGLFKNIPSKANFYFTHSYRMLLEGNEGNYATCNYGIDFLAGFEKNNVCGVQFHPEKSQSNGLILLKNFIELPA